eukprot:15363015-Ditylum_brightwellii.AAC.2
MESSQSPKRSISKCRQKFEMNRLEQECDKICFGDEVTSIISVGYESSTYATKSSITKQDVTTETLNDDWDTPNAAIQVPEKTEQCCQTTQEQEPSISG